MGTGGAHVDAAAGEGVLDDRRPGGGSVAPPQLDAVGAVVGGEEEGAVDVGQIVREGPADAGPDPAAGDGVLDEGRPRRGAVALPQLDAVGAVVGAKKRVPLPLVMKLGPEPVAPG
ncbi:MAG: hypothetical protein ACRDK5_10720 [Solirubrobacterales bacterium]